MNLKKTFQKPAVTKLPRIKENLNRFGMASVICIGRVRHVSTSIANPRGNHARKTAEKMLHPQKQPPARMARSSVTVIC